VQGLRNAKEIWDVLKTTHEGDMVTKITKRETIEGELGRFVLNKGEVPQAMYNWLKTMVNQVRNLGSTKWDDHEMVKVILRSLVFHNPTQVQLIHGDPRYKQISPEEVISKFVSFELMIKDSKHIVNLEQGATCTPEVQPVAFKATEERKEESTLSRLPIDSSKLDNEEMTLIIKSFWQILKQRKGKVYKPGLRGFAIGVVSLVTLLLNVDIQVTVTETITRKGRRWRRKDTTRRRLTRRTWGGNGTLTRAPLTPPTRTPPTWPSTRAFSSQTSARNASWLRTTERRRYIVEKPPKYTTFDDESSSSDNEDDLTSLFANLTKDQKKKINELIESIN
jgi:hypothetical protein